LALNIKMGGGASSIPMHIDKATFRQLSGGTINDAIFDANAVGGLLSRDKLMELSQMKDSFLSFDWGLDVYGRNINERVNRINAALRAKGLINWKEDVLPKENMLATQVCSGVDKSRSVVCFITKTYVDKVLGNNPADNCYMEFNYTLRRKHPDHMIAVVLEEQLLNQALWGGNIGMALGNSPAIDFVSDDNFDAKIEQIYKRIVKISKHAEGLFAPETVSHPSMLSQTNKSKEEQQFFQWLTRSTTIDESRRIIYCASFARAGVGSVFVLAKMMQSVPNFLTTIGVNEYDADQIALAVRDLGLGYNPVRDFDQSLTIESVIFALRKASAASEDPTLAESALSCVARVAASNPIMPSILNDAGICEAVLKLMNRNLAHGPSMGHGCLSIHNMSVNNPEISAKLGSLSTCDVLPRTLRSHMDNPTVVFNGCMAIATLALNKENQERFTFTGACDVVIRSLLKHAANPDVSEKCCLAANHLAIGHLENVGKLGLAGGCEGLIQSLTSHPGHRALIEQALQVVNILAIEPINRAKFGSDPSCAALVRALHTQMDYPAVVVHGCNAISTIVMGSAHNRSALGKAQACELTKAILQKYYTHPQLAPVICRTVFALVAGSPEHRLKFNGVQQLLQHVMNNNEVTPAGRAEAKEALLKVQ
jgi:hypothetical protein